MQSTVMELKKPDGKSLPIRIVSDGSSVQLFSCMHEGFQAGSPVIEIKLKDDELHVSVNANILQDFPTHTISLAGAKSIFRNTEVTSILRQLRNCQLTPFDEGTCYYELTQHVNPLTGKRFCLREIATIIDKPYTHVRNSFSLVSPHT